MCDFPHCVQGVPLQDWLWRRSGDYWGCRVLRGCFQSIWSRPRQQGDDNIERRTLIFGRCLGLVCEWVCLSSLPEPDQLELLAGEPAGSLHHQDSLRPAAQGGQQGLRLLQSHPEGGRGGGSQQLHRPLLLAVHSSGGEGEVQIDIFWRIDCKI